MKVASRSVRICELWAVAILDLVSNSIVCSPGLAPDRLRSAILLEPENFVLGEPDRGVQILDRLGVIFLSWARTRPENGGC